MNTEQGYAKRGEVQSPLFQILQASKTLLLSYTLLVEHPNFEVS